MAVIASGSAQRQPPPDRRAVVLDVDGVAVHPELVEQVCGQIGQRVEGVVEVGRGGRVGEAEAEVIRRDDVVAARQLWNQVAEHERARREAVQQHDRGSVGRPGLPVEQALSVDGGVAVVDPRRHV